MPVLPCHVNPSLEKDLERLLSDCQDCFSRNCPQIISISLEIDSVDPLLVFQHLSEPGQLNFYFENRGKREAIAAIDAVSHLQLEGPLRFDRAREFINSCLKSTTKVGITNSPFSGPHFFCSFSFFDRYERVDRPFPPATVFLPRWQVACRNRKCIIVANTVAKTRTDLEVLLQNLWKKLETIRSLKPELREVRACRQEIISQNLTSIDRFKYAVLSCLELIHTNRLSKIVLAQTLDVSYRNPLNLFQSLDNLRQLYPDCYIFSTGNGKGQNFIGASPERSISVRSRQLVTDALAGSAPRGKTVIEDAELANRLLSSAKERHEHQVAVDLITQCLGQLGIVPQTLPLRLRQLSNIQHLWTPIQAKVPANVHPLEIVAELHPTPAVAGAPREIACEEIRHYETFERGPYAAPLGWVDHRGNSEFIVGIRSASIEGDRARLYAGAGIVAGSDPDRELAEIQLKLQALLEALI